MAPRIHGLYDHLPPQEMRHFLLNAPSIAILRDRLINQIKLREFFEQDEATYILRVLRREIHMNLIPEADMAWRSASIASNSPSGRLSRTTISEFIAPFLEDKKAWSSKEYTMTQAMAVSKLHTCCDYFAELYSHGFKYSRIIRRSPVFADVTEPSGAELSRIKKAFYMVETFRNIISYQAWRNADGTYNHGEMLDRMEQWYVLRLEPWEREQFAAILEFLLGLSCLDELDTRQKDLVLMRTGLEGLYRIENMTEYSDQNEVLADILRTNWDGPSMKCVIMLFEQDQGEILEEVLDAHRGPYASSEWLTLNAPVEDELRIGLRAAGYCFWNIERWKSYMGNVDELPELPDFTALGG